MTTRRLLSLVLLTCVVGGSAAGIARAHFTGSDHPSYLYTWHTGGSIPSGWVQALINGALVWDNVTGQCHDFLRVTGGGHTQHSRYPMDGTANTLAVTSSDHTQVTYDSTETWHLNVNVTPGASSVDLWSVSAHENGHVLALEHEGSQYQDTMWPDFAYGQWWPRTLTANDQFRERNIYPGC